MKLRLWMLFIFCFLNFGISFSQNELTSKIVEDKSYQLYQEKKWSELIEFGSHALKNGFDYYYLRMRMGVAYYEKNNYLSAQKHFWKAYSFNSSDDALKEYLYYCSIYLGKFDHARKFSKTFSLALSEKLAINHSKIIDYALLEAGVKTTTTSNLSPAYYEQLGIGHSVGKNISFFHTLTLFAQKAQQQNLNQKQYYLSAFIPVAKSWLVSPSFHYLDRTVTFNVPQPPKPPSGKPKPQMPVVPPASVKQYYVSSLSMRKSISKWEIEVGATVSNIDSIRQTQGNINVAFYPLGNKKFFFTAMGYVQKESISSNSKYAIMPLVSYAPSSSVILSANYLFNQAHHLSEMNGYLVNNSSDLTSSRFTLMSTFIVSKHVIFYLLCQAETKKQFNPIYKTNTNYSYTNYFGGIKYIL